MDRKRYMRDYQRARYNNDPEFRKKSLDRRRQHKLLTEFGITVEQYDQMLEEQNGHCLLCYGVPTERRLAVDHSHATGKIRGLLCFHCNAALGHIYDNVEWLQRASDYLEKHS